MVGDVDADRILWALHGLGTMRSHGRRAWRPFRWAAWAGFVSMLVWTNPVARGFRWRALGRLWAWQAWCRVVRRPIEVSIPQGWRLRFPPWSTLAGLTAATGLHEPSEQLFMFAYLRDEDAVIDVGANLGIYTVACARLGARVVAFEPSSRTRKALEDNIALNAVDDRVVLLPLALGLADGTAALTTDRDAANHLVDPDGAATNQETVMVTTLDSALESRQDGLGKRPVTYLKVDAEGHDEEVLRGGRSTIEHHRPVVQIESWEGGIAVRDFLSTLGYRVYRFDHQAWRLVEYPTTWSGQANFIAVADDRLDMVRARLGAKPQSPPGQPQVRWLVAAR